jgi:hypothetical protein
VFCDADRIERRHVLNHWLDHFAERPKDLGDWQPRIDRGKRVLAGESAKL